MDKININIFTIVIAIILLGLNYWKIYTTSKGLFQISGALLFKYFLRLLITFLFVYLLIDMGNLSKQRDQTSPTVVFIIPENEIIAHDYAINFKDFILNDLNNSDDNSNYLLIQYNSKRNEFFKILPDLKRTQLIEILNNNNLQNLHGYPQKLDLSFISNSKFSENEFLKYEIIENHLIPFEKDSNTFLNQIQSNNLNITFNLKVYLLFLLIVFLMVDILLSLKIIKI